MLSTPRRKIFVVCQPPRRNITLRISGEYHCAVGAIPLGNAEYHFPKGNITAKQYYFPKHFLQ